MYVWVYTSEINAKRIREHYLQAVLRQDIAFFDDVGAGEVATRIQTDTRMLDALASVLLTDLLPVQTWCNKEFQRKWQLWPTFWEPSLVVTCLPTSVLGVWLLP